MDSIKSSVRQRNILIVDGDKELVRSIKDYLDHHEVREQHDLNFLFAGTCKEALRKLRESEVDLVVLEILLPIVNGYYLLKHLKALKRKIPVIIYTRLKGPQDLAKLASMEVDNIFLKQLMKLEDLIRVIVSSGGPKAELDKVLLELQSQIKSLSDIESQSQLKVVTCPRCHMILNKESYFCNNCGQKLFKPVPVVAVAKKGGKSSSQA